MPIKNLGLHNVSVTLHPAVTSTVIVNVARTEEEAARQAVGEDVTAEQQAETDEITPDVEEIFDEGVEVELSDESEKGAEEEAGVEIAADAASEVAAEAETKESVVGTDGDGAAEDDTSA